MKDLGAMIHVGVTVGDIERSFEFYNLNFGFEKVAELNFTAYEDGFFADSEDAPQLYGVASGTTCPLLLLQVPGGRMILELFQFTPQKKAETVPWDRPGITHFAFETTRFDELYERLSANGVHFLMRPGTRAADGLKWIFLRDPDGNMIELLGSNAG